MGAMAVQAADNTISHNYLKLEEAQEKELITVGIRYGKTSDEEKQRLEEINNLDKQRDIDIFLACNRDILNNKCRKLVAEAEKAKAEYKHPTKNYLYKLEKDYPNIYAEDYENLNRIIRGRDKDYADVERQIRIFQNLGYSREDAKRHTAFVYGFKFMAEAIGGVIGGK